MSQGEAADRTTKMVEALRKWQSIERKSIEQTSEMMEKTDNPLLRQLMEIIRNDSVQHHRVQQFIIDSLTTRPVTLAPEELETVWTEIRDHEAMERGLIALARDLKENSRFFVQKALIEYLIIDEQKHDTLLEMLSELREAFGAAGDE